MMTIGCERIASRLERLEREAQIATEQARIEAASLANRSFWERSWDHIWTHKVGYGLVALLVVGTYYIVSYFPKPKQQEEEPSQRNNPSAESSHKIEENVILQQPPVQHGEENNQLLEVNTQHQNQPIVEAENQGGIEISPDVFIIGEDEIEDPIVDNPPAEVHHEEAQASNQPQTLNQINNPISPHSLIGMPNFNKPKTMLALEYHPKTLIDIVIPDQVVNFLNQQPVNHPWQPNSNVFNEPFIQHYEKTFKQKPILLLTYDPNRVLQPETQIEGFQKVNESQQINIPQMLADYAAMKANHTEPIIVEVSQPAGIPEVPKVAENAPPSIDIAIPRQIN